ncbi:MAG: hypothetical protein WC533_04540 [Candidatus Pacearchaeota archaeon]
MSHYDFKDILLWLAIFVAGSLIVTFLVYPGSFQLFKYNLGNIGGNIKEDIDKLPSGKTFPNECPSGVIPDKVKVRIYSTYPENSGWETFEIADTWLDEQKIEMTSLYYDCTLGNQQNQNVNYYYCFPSTYSWQEQIEDDAGVILGWNGKLYDISLVLAPTDEDTWEKPKTGSYLIDTYKNFSVVSASCENRAQELIDAGITPI